VNLLCFKTRKPKRRDKPCKWYGRNSSKKKNGIAGGRKEERKK
jgi:hypothetical protein